MVYAESESMALKRLKVALKRKDWPMFEYGLSRVEDMLNSGTKISEIQAWYKILEAAKQEQLPREHIQKLSTIIENIMQAGSTKSPAPETQPGMTDKTPYSKPSIVAPRSIVKSPDIPFTIYIDDPVSPEQVVAIEKLHHTLNKIVLEGETSIDISILSGIAKLIKSSEDLKQEFTGLEDLLISYPDPGIIVTTGLNSKIIDIFHKNNIAYGIEGIKQASSDKHWKIYPLGGMLSIFWCPTCNTKSFYPNSALSVVSICQKCSSPAYPSLYLTNSDNTLSSTRLWYLAYHALTNSANWLIISPPDSSEKSAAFRLLLEASHNSIMENAFLVSNKSETGTWWRNKLEETNPNANVAPVCFNVEILYNNYIKTPEKTTNT